jgi:hypothetical protein
VLSRNQLRRKVRAARPPGLGPIRTIWVLTFFAADDAGDLLAGAEVLPVRQEQLKERLGERFRELDVPPLVYRAVVSFWF